MTRTLDTSIRPQDDFFGYVNNKWIATNPIPKTETMWGTFYVLRDESWKAVDNIIRELSGADEASLTHDQRLLRNFFASALGFEATTSNQAESVRTLLRAIDEITDASSLARTLGMLHRHDISAFWSPYVGEDDKDSSNQVLRFYQGGLGLPNRDYYLERSARMVEFRHAYKQYYLDFKRLEPSFQLGAWSDVWRFEKQLAVDSWTDVVLRDVRKNYTRLTLADLSKKCPTFDWKAYWEGVCWNTPSDNLVADQMAFVEACVKLIHTTPLRTIKAYLKWSTVNMFAGWVSQDFANLSFGFYGKTLSGQQEMKPLWKRTVLLADRLVIGEALGREYAVRHFPESSKKAVSDIVEEIRRAYHARMDRLSWMSDHSKQLAHRKLDNIKVFVGYPSVWKDLSTLSFATNDIVANILSASAFETDLDLKKVGQKAPEEDWHMNAHTVNAYNHPNRLEIVFPAAILQPPFFDPNASHAANLGGIGAVIGHEFTHGFDDQGCEFDEHGNMRQWQTKAERNAFEKLAENIVRQADAFETVPGTFLQGKLILGEAIADIGGLALAVEALTDKTALGDLFLNFASCECGHITTERAVQLAKTDPHPPSRFRVNCVVNHNDAFYETYNVTETDKLYLPPEKRAKIW